MHAPYPVYPIALLMVLCLLAAPAGSESRPRGGVAEADILTEPAGRAGLRPEVLRLALRAHSRASAKGLTRSTLLTVIDYTLPSSRRRLWVLDLASGRVVARELVAHGRGTGEDLARRFSNLPGSLQSSLGTFITGSVYQGKHGPSLRLRGLDRGLNDRAEARAIVMHGAEYVSDDFVRRVGRLGRSQGCPALDRSVAERVIDLIKNGTVVFAYYPTPELLRSMREG